LRERRLDERNADRSHAGTDWQSNFVFRRRVLELGARDLLVAVGIDLLDLRIVCPLSIDADLDVVVLVGGEAEPGDRLKLDEVLAIDGKESGDGNAAARAERQPLEPAVLREIERDDLALAVRSHG